MRFALLLPCLLAFAGCNSQDVSVSGWSDGRDITEKTYCLVGGTQDTTPNDLEFYEFGSLVRRGLVAKGYSEAPIDKAALLVSLAYGINGPYPAAYASMSDLSYPDYTLADDKEGLNEPQAVRTSFGGGLMYHEHGFGGPTYYGGYSQGYVRPEYVRFLSLAAYDNAGSRRGNQRWRVDAVSSGTESDLRKLMPFMVAASYEYAGNDTGRQISITISKKDPRYKTVVGSR